MVHGGRGTGCVVHGEHIYKEYSVYYMVVCIVVIIAARCFLCRNTICMMKITQFKKGLPQMTVAHTVAFHFGMQMAF